MQGKLGERLDEFFSSETPSHHRVYPIFLYGDDRVSIAHGNEPGHHVIFLYNAARQPWKTTDLTHRVLKQLYTDKPAGLCGNEDCGQMSAWYVFASLGFLPRRSLERALRTRHAPSSVRVRSACPTAVRSASPLPS